MIESSVVKEFRIGMRRLIRTPEFTLPAALCLALGFGSVITILALINGLFFKPLPGLERPEELVTLHFDGPTSVPNLLDVRGVAPVLSGVGAFTADLATVRVGEVAERMLATAATADYFTVLGTQPALGRFFRPEEDGPPGAHQVAVVSHDFWRRQLGSDPTVLGNTVWVNGHPQTLVGVAPPGFLGTFTGFPVDVWLPMATAEIIAPGFDPSDRERGGLEFVARLGEGGTMESARAAMNTTAARLEAAYPDINRDFRIDVRQHTGFDEEVRMPVVALAAVLLAVAGLVLLIACLNFTNMLLARSSDRTKEAAIRRALGVGRKELMATLLAENVQLALIGTAGGLASAYWLSGTFTRFLRILPVRVHLELGLDWRVIVTTLGLAILVAVATGLVPALRVSGGNLTSALRGGARGGRKGVRLLRFLLGGQLAGATTLLVVAGLLLQTVVRATRTDPGFELDDLRVVSFLDASLLGIEETESADFFRRLEEEVRAVRGVIDAAVSSGIPLAFGGLASTEIRVGSMEPPPGQDGFEATMAIVSPTFHETMGIRVLQGRELRASDGPQVPGVTVISEALAERFWFGSDPLGNRLQLGGATLEIVGVVANVLRVPTGTPAETLYVPLSQLPAAEMSLLVRLAPEAASAPAGVASAIRSLSPDLPTVEPQPLSELLLLSLLPQRVASTVGGSLGLVGLLLAALGVYGLVAFSISQRRREMGIRMAVGASRVDVLILVFRETLRLAGWGVGMGLVMALGAGQLVRGLLVGVSPSDPVPFVAGALLVGAFSMLATVVPARRAAYVEPVVALTSE